jgi:phosphate:Na+ symporter
LIMLTLVGYVVLLLWGMRMVQSGVERAFGSNLRRALGRALRNRLVAVSAGTAVTMLLQSSTATAMMVTSFAARGAVDLIPALAVMLGANVGTALIVKALSFNISWAAPLLLLIGYVTFKRSPKGRWRDLGRVGIGLGLMLLALHGLVETTQPVSGQPILGQILSEVTGDPVLDVLLAAGLTFAAHSSVAVMLLLVGLTAGNVITPTAAVALVLGANLGGALPPVLETSATNPANRRVPVGNLLFRAIGCIAVLPLGKWVAETLWQWDPDPASAITTFHLAFNAVLAVACVGVLGPMAAVLTRLFPEKRKGQADGAQPLFLDPVALDTPYQALANAAREMLRMGDLIDVLMRLVPAALTRQDKATSEQAVRLGRALDALHEAVKAYLAKLDRSELTERDTIRLSDLIEFAVNIGQAGDILERRIVQASRQGPIASEIDRDAALRLHAQVSGDLKLALSTMMTEDQRSARELVDAKRSVNEAERAASRDHLARLGGGNQAALEASSPFLLALRDLKQVNSHLASIGYAIMEPEEHLIATDAERSEDRQKLLQGS